MRMQRNRHTGKVNSAKRAVLDRGKAFRSSDGRIYRQVFTDRGFRRGPMVRDFAAEGRS